MLWLSDKIQKSVFWKINDQTKKTELIARFCFYKVAVLLDEVVCFEIVNVVVVEFYAVGVSAE